MNRYIKILIQVIPWYFKNIFVDKFKLPEPTYLPKKVGKYRFLKTLSIKGFPFGTGLYQDRFGNKVVIKIWDREQKDIYYFNLLHQIEVMKVITNVQNRLPEKKLFGFSTPKFIDAKVYQNKAILIMENAAGKSMHTVQSAKVQFRIYKKCLKFLEILSTNLTDEEKKIITTKNVWDFVFLYPLILPTAIFMQFKMIPTFISGTKTFFKGVFPLTKLKPDRLVHGDLHPDNILITKNNKFSLIDLENVRLCYPEYEPITTISLKGNSKEFKNLVIKEYLNQKRMNKNKRLAIDLLIVNNSIHNLSGDRSFEGVKSYKKAIELVIN